MSDNKAIIHPKTGNLVTAKGRMLWNSLFQPRKKKGAAADSGKYELTVMFPGDADLSVLRDAAVEAGKEKFPKQFKASVVDGKQKWPQGIANPFKKTADYDRIAEHADAFPVYIAARDKNRPGVVGPNGVRVEDEEQAYAGRWCKASIQAFAYDTDGNKGVTFGLVNVQLLDNDDALVIGGGKPNVEAEFEAVDGAAAASGEAPKASANALFE